MRLVAEVVGQLDLQRALDQPLGQLRQHPARPDDLLLRPRAGQQLVDHLVRELAADLIRHAHQGSQAGAPALAWRLAAAPPRARHSLIRNYFFG